MNIPAAATASSASTNFLATSTSALSALMCATKDSTSCAHKHCNVTHLNVDNTHTKNTFIKEIKKDCFDSSLHTDHLRNRHNA